MISEGSRDTEDWGNDAEKSALPSQEKITLYIQIENSNFEVYISQYYCLFLLNKLILDEHNRLLQKLLFWEKFRIMRYKRYFFYSSQFFFNNK